MSLVVGLMLGTPRPSRIAVTDLLYVHNVPAPWSPFLRCAALGQRSGVLCARAPVAEGGLLRSLLRRADQAALVADF